MIYKTRNYEYSLKDNNNNNETQNHLCLAQRLVFAKYGKVQAGTPEEDHMRMREAWKVAIYPPNLSC